MNRINKTHVYVQTQMDLLDQFVGCSPASPTLFVHQQVKESI